MTLNQVIQRIKILADAHKQLQSFSNPASITDALNDRTVAYPACFSLDVPGSNIDVVSKTLTFSFRLFFLDLVNVIADTELNGQDVQSDMLNIGMDFLAQMDYSGYTDWRIAASSPVVFVTDTENDRVAGITVDVSIITPWNKNICAIPANSFTFPIIDTTMKPVYDMAYTAIGSEGSTLTIPQLRGNNILMMVRETFTQFEVTAFDGNNSTQFLWAASNDPLVNINLGVPVTAGERFLFLYRKF